MRSMGVNTSLSRTFMRSRMVRDHTGQAYAELVVELLADGAHTAVAEVVDIVHFSLGVDELDEVLDDLDDIFAGEHFDIHRRRQAQLLVDAVAAYLAEVVALLARRRGWL